MDQKELNNLLKYFNNAMYILGAFALGIVVYLILPSGSDYGEEEWTCGTCSAEISSRKNNLTELGEEALVGEKLFKANCAACHKVDKNSVGPGLGEAQIRWEEAGEGEFIYEFIQDPLALYESGKSKRAIEIWDFSPIQMTPQAHLSKKEIEAILLFVETCSLPVY